MNPSLRLLKLSAVSFLCATAAFAQSAPKAAAAPAASAHSDLTPLHTGWQLQSGCKVTDTGDAISTAAYKPAGWTSTTVPNTILAAQVAAGQVKDPDYGMNLRSAPGMTTMTPPPPPAARAGNNANANANRRPGPVQNADGSWPTYAIGANFSGMNYPPDSPYHCAWWYRTTFHLPATDKSKVLWLRIGGVNYRANVWLNGQRIADSSQIQGAFQTFDLNVTAAAKPGQENVLAFETFGPTAEDLTISWADWSPDPPDKEMGLWETVALATTGPVAVKDPMVTTHFPDDSLHQADLTVYGELRNGTDKPVHGTLSATVAGIHVEQPVDLAANESRSVVFSPADFPKLHVQNPTIWWPWQMGKPNLETATLRFTINGQLSDEVSQRFGIREVTDELTEPKGCAVPAPHPPNYVPSEAELAPPPRNPTAQANNAVTAAPARGRRDDNSSCADIAHRLYKVNGKPILIRGGGWAPDMLLRNQPDKLAQEFRMVRDMGLNTIRSEGKMETDDFLNLADQNGILVMIGWTCCDRYERWRNWTPENQTVAVASLHSQILRMRSHPSVFLWLNGSDNPPPANIEHLYLDEEAKLHFPDPTLSSATAKPTSVTGQSGVKMNGPYDFVAPDYWTYSDPTHKYGGAWGFSTEIGPGPAIPTLESMKKWIPAADIWPHDAVWNFHNAGGGFARTTKFDTAMDNTYGHATTAEDYDKVAQAMAYDGERAMFEAYSRNKYMATGVIQWMLNNSWPSNFWHLYDYYLGTGGGYFGTKKADEPLHIQYSYDDHSIWVINSTYTASPELVAQATVYDNTLKQLFDKRSAITVAADGATRAIPIDDAVFHSGAPLYFVSLQLRNKAGEVLSRNFYWVSSKQTVFNWNSTNYTGTAPSQYEDMTALRQLPEAKVEATAHIVNGRAEVHLHNTSSTLAFQLRVFTDPTSKGVEPFPVLWSDDFVSLLPGESITLSAQLAPSQHDPAIHLTGWNIPPQTLHASAGAASNAAKAKAGE